MKQYDYEFRGLEFHATRMWESAQVIHALEFMQKYEMTHLIFHMNELLDVLVLPRKLYSLEEMWAYWPVRQDTAIYNREYIKWVVKQCKMRGINFIVQAKEIWVFESLFEMHPELGLRDAEGHVCPTNPFWPEYMEMRLEELFTEIPDIDGFTVSLGTRESKVSLAANRCTCNRCKEAKKHPTEWYKTIIEAMYRPLKKRGKKLIVRDFSYDVSNLNAIVDACREVSKDIIISLKTTPHDYYIPFPTNPRIGQTGDATQYIEYDVWGQFYGMGLFPVGIDEDMKIRLKECKEKGASGAYFRSDLETTRESSCYNSLNMVNQYAAAMLTKDLNTDLDDIYKAWINDGVVKTLLPGSFNQIPVRPTAPDAWKRFRDFMHASWKVMEKTHYVRGHVFLVNGKIPLNMWEADGMMITIHGREDWDPGSDKLIEPTEENIRVIMREKEDALDKVQKLSSILDVDTIGLPQDLADDIKEVLDLYYYYVKMIKASTEAIFFTKKAMITKSADDIKTAKQANKYLGKDILDEITRRMDDTDYPHFVYHHFIPDRIASLAEDCTRLLKN